MHPFIKSLIKSLFWFMLVGLVSFLVGVLRCP